MKPHRKTECYSNAFTLTETIVVIGIISLLAALTAPGFINLAPSRKAQTLEIFSFLEMARSRAKALGQDVYICFANEDFPETDHRFRAVSLYVASSIAEESNPVDTRKLVQTEPWLQTGPDTMFGIASDFAQTRGPTLTVLDSTVKRAFPVNIAGQTYSISLPYLLFNKAGRVEVPTFNNNETFVALIDGRISDTGQRIIFGADNSQQGELIAINRNTGKISRISE